jgi:hypothetical protein
LRELIDGILYNTDSAHFIASDRYWDGTSWESEGRNVYLYKTGKGRYFLHLTSVREGEINKIISVTDGQAKSHLKKLPVLEIDIDKVNYCL